MKKKEKATNFISWITADTYESIPVSGNGYKKTFTVYLVCPDGTLLKEDDYQGDGVFGGQNVFELYAHWNYPDECAGDSAKDIEIGFNHYLKSSEKVKHPMIINRNPDKKIRYYSRSEICEFQGWFYEEAEIVKQEIVDILDDYLLYDLRKTLQCSICVDKKIEHIFTTEKIDQVISALFSNLRKSPYLN